MNIAEIIKRKKEDRELESAFAKEIMDIIRISFIDKTIHKENTTDVCLVYFTNLRIFDVIEPCRLGVMKTIVDGKEPIYGITLVDNPNENIIFHRRELNFTEFRKILNHIVKNGWNITEEGKE